VPRWISTFLVFAGLPVWADTAAVLPFSNHAAAAIATQSNADWIGESIAETVRDALSSRNVVTLERDDVQEAYRRLSLRERSALTDASIMKLGETLDAEEVVYGTFEFAPAAPTPAALTGAGSRGSLKISVRILDRRRLKQSPEFVETGAVEDLATLEAHVAWRALAYLAPALAPPESDFRTLRMPTRLDAEENYVRGLLATAPDQKERYFAQAARLDARFMHPCYQLGRLHYNNKEYREAAEWLEKVGSADVHFREASFLLGLARYQAGDYAGAQKAFEAIVETVPLAEVYNDLGAAQSRRNLPVAIDNFKKALEGDPNDPLYHFNLGYALLKKGDFAAAADRFRAVLDRQPEDQTATILLGRSLKKQTIRSGEGATADARLQGLERLKTNYEERAYWQLKAALEPSKP
jgi:tetratricopeptide (TPR) repeat protein